MWMTMEGRHLAAAIKSLITVIDKRNVHPILNCVHLRMDGAKLVASGTDLDLELEVRLDVIEATDNFNACIDARLLFAAIRTAGPAPVALYDIAVPYTVRRDGEDETKTKDYIAIDVADGDAVYHVEAQDVADYPEFKHAAETFTPYERFTNGQLSAMLDVVTPAISTEETRYYLNGVYWKPGALVATDGYRLVEHKYTHTGDEVGEGAIIPKRAVDVLSRLARGADVDTAFVRFEAKEGALPTPSAFRFDFGMYRLTTKVIDGTYPDYARVIPKPDASYTTFAFDAGRLKVALRKVVDFHKVARNGNAVAFTNEDGYVVLRSASRKDELSSTDFVAKTFAPWPETDIEKAGYNMRYLDAAITTEGQVEIIMADHGAPAIVRVPSEPDVTRVIMPMRV